MDENDRRKINAAEKTDIEFLTVFSSRRIDLAETFFILAMNWFHWKIFYGNKKAGTMPAFFNG